MIESEEIIRMSLPSLCSVLGKKFSAGLADAWVEHLRHFSVNVIKRAFTRMERECERWPSLKVARSICGEEQPSQGYGGRFTQGIARNEFGENVPVLFDSLGNPKEPLFRATDCSEGREFLALIRKLAAPKELTYIS